MTAAGSYEAIGMELVRMLNLNDVPVALKVHYEGEPLPEYSLRPFKDTGKHHAMCQAVAIARHHRKSVTLLKEDHWCIWPLISYGMVKIDSDDLKNLGDKHFMKDADASRNYFKYEYPRLAADRTVAGFTVAPLTACGFAPDIVMIYCYPGQLRSLLMAAKYETGKVVTASLDTCASCVHATIPVLNGEKPYNLSIPDPGEYERGLCDEDLMIFTLSADRLQELIDGLRTLADKGFGYRQLSMDMNFDYSRPEFYNAAFEKWGLPRGETWRPDER